MNAVLQASDIVAGYRPDLPILHGVGARVAAGEVVTIIGPNGAGKSTLIKAIAGLVHVTSGRIEIDGRETTGMAAHRLADAGVAYVPQTGNVFTSLTIQENADPDVQADLNTFMTRLVREDPSLYRHTAEGPDDMPAHIRSALTDVSISVPVAGGGLMLGTWQGIYLFEHRRHPHRRRVSLHLLGGAAS